MKKNIVGTLVVALLLPYPKSESQILAQLTGVPGGYLIAANSKTVKKRTAKSTKAQKKPAAKKQTKVAEPVVKSAPIKAAPAIDYERVADKQVSAEVQREINSALNLSKQGKYEEASLKLFQMSRSPKFIDQRMQVKYLLGMVLSEMGLYQVAAFQFISVVRDGASKYVRPSLEKLAVAADKLNDDTMLNYAMSKVTLSDFPKVHQDMLRYRIGEIQYKSKLFEQSVKTLSGVTPGSEWYAQAKYLEGLANTEGNRLNEALKNFSDLANSQANKGVNHPNRVSGLMGMARVYYQQKNWDSAIDMYRQVPRDSEMWHDTLFEISWAQMRAAEFRNVLSNFQSLHSTYYEDFYIPESVLLRSIVYLYICQYDEMEKTLDLFERIYKPVLVSLTGYLKAYSKPMTYYDEVNRQQEEFEKLKTQEASSRKVQIPFLVARNIMKEGDFSRASSYIMKIREEWKKIEALEASWKNSALGTYSKKLLQSRMSSAKKVAGKHVRDHVVSIRNELASLFEQHGFARYELANGRTQLKKKSIAGKDINKQINQDEDRTFYVQNGFEFWPFTGEYWLDEIGNYHYLGTQRCD